MAQPARQAGRQAGRLAGWGGVVSPCRVAGACPPPHLHAVYARNCATFIRVKAVPALAERDNYREKFTFRIA